MRDDPTIPDSLQRALKRSAAPDVEVPQPVDRAIIADARRHLLRRRWRPWLGVAAAIALVAVSVFVSMQPDPELQRVALRAAPMDVNFDRQVNILDALASARRGDEAGAQAIAAKVVEVTQ